MMCLDCPMHKFISDWFGHVQVAPTVLTVELKMAYLDACGDILELITPAQGGINDQHCTRVAMPLVLVASRHAVSTLALLTLVVWHC